MPLRRVTFFLSVCTAMARNLFMLFVFAVCVGLYLVAFLAQILTVDIMFISEIQTKNKYIGRTVAERIATKSIVPASFPCQFTKIEGYWSRWWKWINEGCEKHLTVSESMHFLESYMGGKLVFIGDSQMRSLRISFFSLFQYGKCKEDTNNRVDRCEVASKYLGLKKPSVWVQPNHTLLEGPVGYGLENRGATT